MSVYTAVPRARLETLLTCFQAGRLVSVAGIAGGIENSNFFVTTGHSEMVLTLFEHLEFEQVAGYMHLLDWLSERGLPVPRPFEDRKGQLIRVVEGKPAAFFPRFPGAIRQAPAAAHCAAAGAALGRLHRAGLDYPALWANPYDLQWARDMAAHLPDGGPPLLRDELAYQAELDRRGCPKGLIHGDLFRDNVLFEDERVSALLDFYNAGRDLLIYDLAITVNDWCVEADGELDPQRVAALAQAYHRERKIRREELRIWPAMLRAGALRFWVSRLRDQHFPRDGALTFQKDPEVFRQMLQRRMAAPERVLRRMLGV